MKENQQKKFTDKNQFGDMPSLNRYSSRKEWEGACWQKILASEELLGLLTTSNERHDLVMRAVALDRLSNGKTYSKISEELSISPQTISLIKKSILEKNYRSYFERSKKERKRRIYSSSYGSRLTRPKQKSIGMRRRTKYGTIYIP